MLSQAIGALHDLGRLHEIAVVLIRYGFGDQVRRIGLAGVLEEAGRVLHWRAPEELVLLEPPVRARRALEDLGPTFVKLGQILATRVDLLPSEWISEFSKLQDVAPAVPFDMLRPQLREDLGTDPERVFAALDAEPVATALLAQVYRGRLFSGSEVVLKVRRPGIRTVVEADLRLLAHLAEVVETEAPELRRFHMPDLVRQFTVSLRRELDFAAECRNAERIAANFAWHPEIVLPRIHWRWVGERLNVQDLIQGIPGRDLAAVDVAGLDRGLLARREVEAELKMMLEDGFFQAAPHPGNVFYLPDNRIAFISVGMMGQLTDERRYQVAVLLNGLVSHDAEAVVDILLDWEEGDQERSETELDRLKGEIGCFVDHYRGVSLKQLDLGATLTDLLAILREHGLVLPPDLTLLIKAFINLEGRGRQLDPDFDMAASAAPFLKQVLLDHVSPANMIRRGRRTLSGAATHHAGLPQGLRQPMRVARCGKPQFQVEILPFKQFGRQLDRAASWQTLAIITAVLIVGSAIVIDVGGAPGPVTGLPSSSLLGLLGVVFSGQWLLVSILRNGRKE